MDGGGAFRDSFAAALAAALQENETKTLTPAEQVRETYTELCYDDPHNLNAAGLELLAEELADPKSQYALSNRFVQGLEQVLKRPSTVEEDQKDQSTDRTYTRSFRRAICYLAWTVHVKIPLECLQICSNAKLGEQQKIGRIGAYLGSFQGTVQAVESDTDVLESMNQAFDAMGKQSTRDHAFNHQLTQIERSPARNPQDDEEGTDEEHTNDHPATTSDLKGDHDSLEEVWAAESDPDDFEFDSGYNYQDELKALDDWAQSATIDPKSLSAPLQSYTWQDISVALTSLMAKVSYTSYLSGLSDSDWKNSWQSCWTTLIMSLLVLPSTNPGLSLWAGDYPGISPGVFQKVGLQLTQAIRDAALDRPSELLEVYIELLQQLLQVQSTRESEKKATSVLPVTWIGMGSLAALCESIMALSPKVPASVHLVQTGVVQACEDLNCLLECAQGDVETYAAVQWAFVSFFRMLLESSMGAESKLPSSRAQPMLQSGMYRQYLLHWSSQKEPERDDIRCAKQYASQIIWQVCAASPSLLGKYSWRFPDVAAEVTRRETNETVDVILWSLLGIHLSLNDTPGLVLRNTNTRSPPKQPECRNVAWSLFQQLCHDLRTALFLWREQLENSPAAKSIDTMKEQTKADQLVREFGRFVSAISHYQLAAKLLLTEMVPKADGKNPVALLQACMSPLKDVLQDWPSITIEANTKQEDEEVLNNSTQKRQRSHVVHEARRCLKTLATVILNNGESERSSSKAD